MIDCKMISRGRFLIFLVLFLGACDARLPPSSPSKPHTLDGGNGAQLRKAVFQYDLPCVQTVHPAAPSLVQDCEWQAHGGSNHGQVALSN